MADAVLPDGSYDALVIDAMAAQDALHLELTIVAGERKGEVVTVSATGLDRDELDVMGLPATIIVTDGAPVVQLEG